MKTRNVLTALVALAVGGPQLGFAQDHAVVIGNSDYAGCAKDLSGVVGDVVNKHNALDNAGWTVNNKENRTKAEMQTDINGKLADLPSMKKYIVWYSGHGVDPTGDLVGVDCGTLTANDLVTALKHNDPDPVRPTLVILDSCFGADFANAVNTKLGGDPATNGVGFITAGSKGECVKDDGLKGLFSRCFIEGLNGEADLVANGGNGDGEVTVKEAADYAVDDPNDDNDHHCVFVTPGQNEQHPTWDNEHGDWVIGKTKEGAGFCTLPDGRCLENISQGVCEEKGGTHAVKCIPVPAVSEWGLIVLTLLVLTAGTIVIARRRQALAT